MSVWKSSFVGILVLFIFAACSAATFSGVCKINVKSLKPSVQPLLLKPDSSQFLYPKPFESIIIKTGEKIRLACPGVNNSFAFSNSSQLRDITARCVNNDQFQIGNFIYPFNKLTCQSTVETTAVSTGRCPNSTFSHIKIGFDLGTDFSTTLEVCFDKVNYDAVYSKFKLTPSIYYKQFMMFRPEFNESAFYGRLNMPRLYSRKNQRRTLSRILGSEELAWKYIQLGIFNFIARGHLAAVADFVHSPEQRSTFFYVNTAPQWQLFNVNNWVSLEKSVRSFAADRTRELDVFTGTWGISSLPDVYGRQQPLHMYVDYNNNRAVKVPGYFWKVLYDPVTKEGAAFVGINNPHLTSVNGTHVFCKDICNSFDWLFKDRHDIRKGYLFCCSVDDFRRTVKTLPYLQIDSIFS